MWPLYAPPVLNRLKRTNLLQTERMKNSKSNNERLEDRL